MALKIGIGGNSRSGGGASSADKVSYDNTNSGLQSTNVQGAIDEVGANLGGFNFDLEYSDDDEYGNEIYTFINQQQLIDFKRLYLNGNVNNISVTISSLSVSKYFAYSMLNSLDGDDGSVLYVEIWFRFDNSPSFTRDLLLHIDFKSIGESDAVALILQTSPSQSEYDEMQYKDSNTLYFITD